MWHPNTPGVGHSSGGPVGADPRPRRDEGVVGYVAEALEDEERRAALRAWLADQESAFGPIPADILEEVRAEWLGAAHAQR